MSDIDVMAWYGSPDAKYSVGIHSHALFFLSICLWFVCFVCEDTQKMGICVVFVFCFGVSRYLWSKGKPFTEFALA
jgi:hypothetical protein